MRALALVMSIACSSSKPAPAPVVKGWPIPAGWKSETIPFPLDFAPTIAHTGVEELRFPPGFTEVGAPNRWSYAFEWRLSDAADLDAIAITNELTAYFRGLLVAVDGDKKRFTADSITAYAEQRGDAFAITAVIFDAFSDAARIELVGTAKRTRCGSETVWRFALYPAASPLRTQLDELVTLAVCE